MKPARLRVKKYRSKGGGADLARVEVLVPPSARAEILAEEPRHYRTALEVDELGCGSSLFKDCRVVADGCDVTRSHRDGLRQS